MWIVLGVSVGLEDSMETHGVKKRDTTLSVRQTVRHPSVHIEWWHSYSSWYKVCYSSEPLFIFYTSAECGSLNVFHESEVVHRDPSLFRLSILLYHNPTRSQRLPSLKVRQETEVEKVTSSSWPAPIPLLEATRLRSVGPECHESGPGPRGGQGEMTNKGWGSSRVFQTNS